MGVLGELRELRHSQIYTLNGDLPNSTLQTRHSKLDTLNSTLSTLHSQLYTLNSSSHSC